LLDRLHPSLKFEFASSKLKQIKKYYFIINLNQKSLETQN